MNNKGTKCELCDNEARVLGFCLNCYRKVFGYGRKWQRD